MILKSAKQLTVERGGDKEAPPVGLKVGARGVGVLGANGHAEHLDRLLVALLYRPDDRVQEVDEKCRLPVEVRVRVQALDGALVEGEHGLEICLSCQMTFKI